MTAPTLLQYPTTKLKEDGYDGLSFEECGCGLDDLVPCDAPNMRCVCARAVKCTWDDSKGEGPMDACCECESTMPGGTCYWPADRRDDAHG